MRADTLKVIKVLPTDTQDRFIHSPAMIAALIGPEGEGKTWAGMWAMVEHARKHYADKILRAAIIRDTFENIKDKTIPSIQKASDGKARFFDSLHQMKLYNVHCYLFGIADIGALNKLQGAEYGLIWLEEPAPMQSRANSGLSEDVFNRSLYRCTRQVGAPKLLITMNPADEDHWSYDRLVANPITKGTNPDYPDVDTEVFFMQPGENPTTTEIGLQAREAAYKNNPEEYQRYVMGKFSFVSVGEAVTPEYNSRIHRSDYPIDANHQFETIRMWDGGLNPTCVILQITPKGRIFCLDTLRGENIGMRQLIKTQLKPLLEKYYCSIDNWRDLGDPALTQREQSDSSQTAAQVIEEELGTHFEPGEMNWDNRREALKEMLNRLIDGEPMFQVSSSDSIMHRALRGGWHYKVDNNGKVMRDKAVKDLHSHPGDALSHGIAKIIGKKTRDESLDRLREHRKKLLEKRAERFTGQHLPQRQRISL